MYFPRSPCGYHCLGSGLLNIQCRLLLAFAVAVANILDNHFPALWMCSCCFRRAQVAVNGGERIVGRATIRVVSSATVGGKEVTAVNPTGISIVLASGLRIVDNLMSPFTGPTPAQLQVRR